MEKKFRITVENTVYTVTIEDLGLTGETAAATPVPALAAAASAPASNLPREVRCRLGGIVHSIEVSVGQMVKEGEKVMIVEAMKMKTAMPAICSGKILAIAAKVGEKVETGQVLLTIGA